MMEWINTLCNIREAIESSSTGRYCADPVAQGDIVPIVANTVRRYGTMKEVKVLQ